VSGGFQAGGRYSVTNYTLRALIAAAYLRPQVNPNFLIEGGPAWIDADHFDVEAKAAEEFAAGPDGPNAPRRVMLQSLLAERFKLKVHHETRQGQIFALTLARNDRRLGPNLKVSTADCSVPQNCAPRIGPGSLTLTGVPLAQLVSLLPRFVDRIVIDSTGLTERYDLQLTWTPGPVEWIAPGNSENPPSDGASLPSALREQLGLRLQSQTGPIDILVIDSAERPSEN
jgi:uncharacterized protein (TIGR03435 family)